MPSRLSRLLSLAIAAVLGLSLTPYADAAKKKTSKPAATHHRARTTHHRASRHPAKPALKQSKQMELMRLYSDYWQAWLKLNPLQATLQGDGRYNDKLPNFLSADFRKQSHEFTAEWLQKVQALGPDGLTGQDLLSYKIFVHDAQLAMEGEHFPTWMEPINPYYNIASIMAMLGSGAGAQPFNTVQDYDNWLQRLSQLPALFDQAIANMREGMKAGVVQPRSLMEEVLPQLDAVLKPTAEETLFWSPIRNMPANFSDADRERLTLQYKRMIDFEIMPAYREMRGFIDTQYLPACRSTDGMSALPDGAAWYAYDVRQSTTTDMTPDQLHAIGLQQVAEIQQQIHQVMKQVKFRGSLEKFFRYMREDKDFAFKSETQLVDYYRSLQQRIDANAPKLFSLVPKAKLEVRVVEPSRLLSAPSGSYMRPAPNGSRPGIFYVNPHDLQSRRTWEADALYLHEGIPGHHYQLGLQQELIALPNFRLLGGETAFIEGWGLYAESLGRDLGAYQDPYSYSGYLQNELRRAIRLVADTGLNAKGWSRKQTVDYMLKNAAISRSEAEAEVDRFMAIPGQALAYKVGEMKIIQLRSQAEQVLGTRFDIRQFHAEVLKDGSVPLDILQEKIEHWVASQEQEPLPDGAPAATDGSAPKADAAKPATDPAKP